MSQNAVGVPDGHSERPNIAPKRRRLIEAKLRVPALPEGMVGRPRLRRQIEHLLAQHRVLVVSATAGSGKTTALVEALQGGGAPIAWLTVDRPDRAAGRLVTYVEAALGRCVPQVDGVAREALAAGLAHTEVAGLLAEAVQDAPVVFVLDELERLEDDQDAWAVIEALLRYAPERMRVVLLSRRRIRPELCRLPSDAGLLASHDLAFTRDEAQEALARSGREAPDVDDLVRATAGWVTGVLLDAYNSAASPTAVDGETDPLYAYLASQILSDLEEEERGFLVASSVLREVTAPRAEALGLTPAARRLYALRRLNLPATWSSDGRTLRYHSFFREHLLEQLELEDDARELRLAHARLLQDEGDLESAIEELLAVGALNGSTPALEHAIVDVVERGDIDVAERWLTAIGPVLPVRSAALTSAALMVHLVKEEHAEATALIDATVNDIGWPAFVASNDRNPWLAFWAYMHTARLEDAEHLLSVLAHDDPLQAVARLTLTTMSDDVPHEDVEIEGVGPAQSLAHIALFLRGDLKALAEAPRSKWLTAMESPWRIAALRAMGQTSEAVRLLDDALQSRLGRQTLATWVGPEVLLDAGRPEEAKALVREGHELAVAGGSLLFAAGACIADAKCRIRADGDPVAALDALHRASCREGVARVAHIRDVAHTWEGLALLLCERDDEAAEHLRGAVQRMQATGRDLELPLAAVCLAEAEWRCGDEVAADAAADVALQTAVTHGSDHLLLQALRQFPAVLSRRLDAEPAADSPWHAIGRALGEVRTVEVRADTARVELHDLGRRVLLVDGEERRPRIAKSYELLAFVAAAPGRQVDREAALEALFGERRDDSVRAYLRQVTLWVRRALPDEGLQRDGDLLRLDPDLTVLVASSDAESSLLEARRLRGDERLDATLAALERFAVGDVLPGAVGPWAQERRDALNRLVVEHRLGAAELALELGRYALGIELADAVLRDEPFRESAWRLRMRLAQMLGDEDAVVRSFHRCETALADFGATPSSSTRQLLETLRR